LFVGKARSCSRVEHLEVSLLGLAPALLIKIRIDWKGLPRTHPLAYYEHS
jgi:hypothetical protein